MLTVPYLVYSFALSPTWGLLSDIWTILAVLFSFFFHVELLFSLFNIVWYAF